MIALATDDSANIKEDKNRMAEVGDIVVEVHRRGEGKSSKPSKSSELENFRKNLSLMVHEKALKGQAQSHGTS